jgi:hypothetical protein
MEAPQTPRVGPLQSVMQTFAAIPPSMQTILLAVIAFGGFVIYGALFPPAAPGTDFTEGQSTDVAITLITADARDLACAADKDLDGARCAFDPDGKPVATSGPVLAPYMTVDNVLLLVPDLWKEPALAKRLAEDPPTDRERSKRFTAKCKMQLARPMKGFFLRWDPNATWQWTDKAWVGSISRCRLEG